MVSGTPGTIICARCGWQNEATARMCGGCGTPLRGAEADPGATSQADTGAAGWAPGQAYALAQDAPTAVSPNPGLEAGAIHPQAYIQPATPPALPQMPTPATLASPPVAWPAAGQSKTKPSTGRFRWWVIPVVILVVIVALGVLGLGIWGLGIQPSTANSLNSLFPSALNSAFTQENSSLTPDHNGQVRISASDLNTLIQAKSPTSGPVTNLNASYVTAPYPGLRLTYNFNVLGTEVQDTTAYFSVEQGRLALRGTLVDGSMSLFMSGDQMEQILNTGLGNLTHIQGKVQSFQLVNDVLVIQLVHA
jgi:hypothetical protein